MQREQEEYAKKVKDIIKDRNLKYSILTMGCQLNENDSEKIAGMLVNMGFTETEKFEDADMVIFNTCCVRENAEEKLFGKIGEIKKIKEKKDLILAIGGCMMQEKEMVSKIRKSYPFVDIVFGTHTLQKLPENVYKAFIGREKVKDVLDIDGKIYEGIPIKRGDNFKASVTIMYGCNNFCTYCIVPYVRGRERSRNPQDILNEVRELANNGYKEITLLGQNVNSYMAHPGADLESAGEINSFAKLLDAVCQVEGIERVRFISPHPKNFTDDVIDAIARNDKIAKIIHLPLQSGNSKVLKEMNRHYTKEQFIELAEKMKKRIPNVVFSTDIIVGFPGETDEEFEDTLDVVRKINFEQIFMFIYSPREGTPSAARTDQVPDDIKHIRFDKLKELYESRVDENNTKYLNTKQKILIEGLSKNNSKMLTGRTDTNKVVIFEPVGNEKIGDIIIVQIEEAHKWYLKAKIIH
jgi:tRNA-2-methylthio-N6-dimethylallyladenosine synthase